GVSMKTYPPTLVVLLCAASLGHAGPVDLSKIDRTIGKEPAYRSRAPRYCLLLFGREAKKRMWLGHDGARLYVARKGHGALTEEGEEVKGLEKRSNVTSPITGERVEARLWRFSIGAVREGKVKHDALAVGVQHFEYTPKEGKPRVVGHTSVTLHLGGRWEQSA